MMAPPSVQEYQFDDTFKVTDDIKDAFQKDGCITLRGLLNPEELELVDKALLYKGSVVDHAWEIDDGEGRRSRLVIWNHPGNDVTGMIGRSEKVAGTCEELLGGEVYHYHTKLMMKEARVGGCFQWHQDYGYWYKNGCLKPDMMTVFIALDECVKETGCLQVLIGSHHCGRVDHEIVGGQQSANLERLAQIKKHFTQAYVDLQPGDAVFFHSNLLHCSAGNSSDHRRWAFLCAYNRADNDPVYVHHCPQYTPLLKVPNTAIITCTNMDLEGKDFMDPKADNTIRLTSSAEKN